MSRETASEGKMAPGLIARLKSLRLNTKLQLSFVLVGFLSVAVTGWQAFENARTVLEKSTFERLTSIREVKKRQIESSFEQSRLQLLTCAEDRAVVEAASPAFRRRDRRERDLPLFEHYRRRNGYEDILLVDIDRNELLFSLRGDSVNGPDGNAPPDRSFRRLVQAMRIARRADTVLLSDLFFPPGARTKPSAWMAAPVFERDSLVAALIVRIPIAPVNRIMTSNDNWGEEGLGETGETYIVGEDYSMRSDSRFFIQDPARFADGLAARSGDGGRAAAMREHATSILLQEVRTGATESALRGTTDTKIIHDYRGVEVLSSWTPLAVPGLRWAIVAEMDTREAFASIVNLRERLILITLAILLLSLALGVTMSRAIARPILALAAAADRFGQGEMSQRFALQSRDEIGFLAQSFNRMADSIRDHTARLQDEIGERMRAEEEVRLSTERLRDLSAHMQTVREEERKGMAREIHDELGQALTRLKIDLALLSEESDLHGSAARERIRSMGGTTDATIKAVKRMITALRPRLLDDLGLTAAIEWQMEDFSRHTGLQCDLDMEEGGIDLDPDRSISIFRILQETLTNVARHAGARRVSVRFRAGGDAVELRVRDDGRGITSAEIADPKSFGLLGIRERAHYWGGSVDIGTLEPHGTVVTVLLPLQGKTLA